MTIATQTRHALRIRGRSFLALVLAPDGSVADWLTQLDEWLRRSPGFFRGRPVVLDLSAMTLDKEGVASLVGDLERRDVRLMGIEGTKSSYLGLGMPPLVSGGKTSDESHDLLPPSEDQPVISAAPVTPPERVRSLLVDSPVRSGQTVSFPHGDVTIIGSVASGAEVIAAGSIHIYGALRGRAIAGSAGSDKARIFCGKLDAEFLAIDGLYRTADDLGSDVRGKPVQAWLVGDEMKISVLG